MQQEITLSYFVKKSERCVKKPSNNAQKYQLIN